MFFLKSKESLLDLDSPDRFNEIRSIIFEKFSLNSLYSEIYHKYQSCIHLSPSNGMTVEIGSGGGFAKEIIPEIITSDAISYSGIDKIMNATQLEFPDSSLSCICMFGVLHHISNPRAFFKEAERCLLPGGRIFMVEPYFGWISTFIYQYLHHEYSNPQAEKWEFESKGPLSDANIALPYIIFERDLKKFQEEFANLSLINYKPHTPLRYWLSGGLKKWSLLPKNIYKLACWMDKKLIELSPRFGSFVDIEIIKK